MNIAKSTTILFLFCSFLAGCKQPEMSTLSSAAANFLKKTTPEIIVSEDGAKDVALEIGEVIDRSPSKLKMSDDFKGLAKEAVISDPFVLSAKANYQSRSASANISKSLKDFQVSGTLYGGIEDVTDETVGVAAVINANKLLYDGGKLDGRISADEYYAVAAMKEYELAIDESARVALGAWVELERYKSLHQLIGSRLEVLGPLITQLERVAKAGLGDVAMVSAAQRTVSMIEVIQTDVEQRLAQAQVSFINVFGDLPLSVRFDGAAISEAVPTNISKDLIEGAPALQLEYAKYQAALASLRSIRATDSINVGFETKIQRPFGESDYDSDESIGLVLRKTLYSGGKLVSEIEASEAQVNAQLESFKSTFRLGDRTIQTAKKTIVSMEKAIVLAKSNAVNTRDEINYLRKQLIIGQSTLDSVLSAEARLYDAEAKEIDFIADRHQAELTILTATGQLSGFLNIHVRQE